jgi:hypothetical protein
MDTIRYWVKVFLLTILLLFVGCAGSIHGEDCYADVLTWHTLEEGVNIYFWDVDCDGVCDGATIEIEDAGLGEPTMIPLTCKEAYVLWEDFLAEQRRMGA